MTTTTRVSFGALARPRLLHPSCMAPEYRPPPRKRNRAAGPLRAPLHDRGEAGKRPLVPQQPRRYGEVALLAEKQVLRRHAPALGEAVAPAEGRHVVAPTQHHDDVACLPDVLPDGIRHTPYGARKSLVFGTVFSVRLHLG